MLTKLNSLFLAPQNSKIYSIKIDGQTIREKTEVKYLGVTIKRYDKKLTFQSEVKNILRSTKIRKTLKLGSQSLLQS